MDSFHAVDISSKPIFDRFLSIFPDNEGSECRFSNLFIWAEADDIKYMATDSHLLIHLRPENQSPCMLMALAQPSQIPQAIVRAIEVARGAGERFVMRSLPKWYCDIMESAFPGRFVFEREAHHDDYIYSAQSMITLSGKKLHSKRNHVNKFLSLYSDRFDYRRYTDEYAEQCMALYDRWLAFQSDPDALRPERTSVCRALSYAGELGLEGGVILIDGVLEAFSLGERITRDMALVHIEKASLEIPGLFSVINREMAANEFADMLWINREEDMGDEGLQRAKQSYQPVRMIEKFCAGLAEEAYEIN